MKVILENIGIGHAPSTAECTLGAEFRFNERLMFKLPDQTVDEIKNTGGELPEDLTRIVAQDGCDNFWEGKCLVQGGRECKG